MLKNLYEMSGLDRYRKVGPGEIVLSIMKTQRGRKARIVFANDVLARAELKAGDRIVIGLDDETEQMVISKSVFGFKLYKVHNYKNTQCTFTVFPLKPEMGWPEKKIIINDPIISGDKSIILNLGR